MQARAVLPCHSPFIIRLLFLLPEPVSCRGQRIAHSNGKKNRSFTKSNNLCSGGLSPYIDSNVFSSFFFKYCNSKAFVCTTRCQDTSTKMYLAYRELPKQKKNGYHFMKNCKASIHQPAHRKICLTLIMCIDMHFHSIFSLSTFYTSKHIFIDFVVLLHQTTTQQNKSASLRFGLMWQSLKKKKKVWHSCQARVVSCCPALLLLSIFFFFI